MSRNQIVFSLFAFSAISCKVQPFSADSADVELGGLSVAIPADPVGAPAKRNKTGQDIQGPPVLDGGTHAPSPYGLTDFKGDLNSRSGRRSTAQFPRITPELRRALLTQRELLNRQDPDKAYDIGGKSLTPRDFLRVIDDLLSGDPGLAPEPVSVADGGSVRFTGYYSPELQASKVRTASHRYPVMRLPASPQARTATRAELQSGEVAALDTYALAWVANPVDVYLMQLQGSGFVVFPDGTRQYLAYARSNGRRGTSIAKAVKSVDARVARSGIRGIRKWVAEDLPNRAGIVDSCQNLRFLSSEQTATYGVCRGPVDADGECSGRSCVLPSGSGSAGGSPFRSRRGAIRTADLTRSGQGRGD